MLLPRALQAPHLRLDRNPHIHLGAQRQHVRRALHEVDRRPAPHAAVEEHLHHAAVQHDLHREGARARVEDVAHAGLAGEEDVREAPRARPVEEEGRVAAQLEAAAQHLACGRAQQREVEPAERLLRYSGRPEAEAERARRRFGGHVEQQAAVAQRGAGRERLGRRAERRQRHGRREQGVAGARDVGQRGQARQRHGGAEALGGRRDGLRVLPVGGPGEADLRRVGRDVAEELTRVVVLGEVGQSGRAVDRGEVRAVEGTREVLGR